MYNLLFLLNIFYFIIIYILLLKLLSLLENTLLKCCTRIYDYLNAYVCMCKSVRSYRFINVVYLNRFINF